MRKGEDWANVKQRASSMLIFIRCLIRSSRCFGISCRRLRGREQLQEQSDPLFYERQKLLSSRQIAPTPVQCRTYPTWMCTHHSRGCNPPLSNLSSNFHTGVCEQGAWEVCIPMLLSSGHRTILFTEDRIEVIYAWRICVWGITDIGGF